MPKSFKLDEFRPMELFPLAGKSETTCVRAIWCTVGIFAMVSISIMLISPRVILSVGQSVSDSFVIKQNATHSFSNVLLVTKFNFNASISHVVFFKDLYEPYFPHHSFVGPWTHDVVETLLDMNISAHSDEDYDTNTRLPWGEYRNGVFAYRSSIKFLRKFPHYDGYLFAHDDMLFKLGALELLDKSAIWVGGSYFNATILNWSDPNVKKGWWFDFPGIGLQAMDDTLRRFPEIGDELKKCYGSEHTWNIGKGDFYYIPRSAAPLFISVCEKFSKSNLFLEIAVPTFTKCFARNFKVESISLCDAVGELGGNVRLIEKKCQTNLIHPVKLSYSLAAPFIKSFVTRAPC
jgi:hypothetical protein